MPRSRPSFGGRPNGKSRLNSVDQFRRTNDEDIPAVGGAGFGCVGLCCVGAGRGADHAGEGSGRGGRAGGQVPRRRREQASAAADHRRADSAAQGLLQQPAGQHLPGVHRKLCRRMHGAERSQDEPGLGTGVRAAQDSDGGPALCADEGPRLVREVGRLPEMAGRDGRLDRGRRAGRGRHAGSLCQGHAEVEAVRAARRAEQRYDRVVHDGRRVADVGLAVQRSGPGVPRGVPPGALAACPRDVLRRPQGRQSRRRLLARRAGVQSPLVPRLGHDAGRPRRGRGQTGGTVAAQRGREGTQVHGGLVAGGRQPARGTLLRRQLRRPGHGAQGLRRFERDALSRLAVLSERGRLRAGHLGAGHDRGPVLRRLLHQGGQFQSVLPENSGDVQAGRRHGRHPAWPAGQRQRMEREGVRMAAADLQ